MGAWQHADFRGDRAYGFEVAPVDTLVSIENVPAHNLGFELLEYAGYRGLVEFRLGAFREEMRHHLFLHRGDSVLAILLFDGRIGCAQVFLGEAEDLFFQRLVVRYNEIAWLFRRLFGQLDDGFDDRLEVAVTKHYGPEHDLFGQLLGLRFHHHYRVLRAGNDEIELAFRHLVERRIEHIFIVDEADARTADRAHEGSAGQCERRGGCDHRDDVGVIFHIVRKHGNRDLRIAAPALGEQRADRAVDQA